MEKRVSEVERLVHEHKETTKKEFDILHEKLRRNHDENTENQLKVMTKLELIQVENAGQTKEIQEVKLVSQEQTKQALKSEERTAKMNDKILSVIKWLTTIVGAIVLTSSANAWVDMTKQIQKEEQQEIQQPNIQPTSEQPTTEQPASEFKKMEEIPTDNSKGGV